MEYINYATYHPYLDLGHHRYPHPVATSKAFPQGVALGTTGVPHRTVAQRLLDLERNDFPGKYERRAELDRIRSKRRVEDFSSIPRPSYADQLKPSRPRVTYTTPWTPSVLPSYTDVVYPLSRYPWRPIRQVPLSPLYERFILVRDDQDLDPLTIEIEAEEVHQNAKKEARCVQSAMLESLATDRVIRQCKERNRIRTQEKRIENARLVAPIYSTIDSKLGTRQKVLINYHKGKSSAGASGRATPEVIDVELPKDVSTKVTMPLKRQKTLEESTSAVEDVEYTIKSHEAEMNEKEPAKVEQEPEEEKEVPKTKKPIKEKAPLKLSISKAKKQESFEDVGPTTPTNVKATKTPTTPTKAPLTPTEPKTPSNKAPLTPTEPKTPKTLSPKAPLTPIEPKTPTTPSLKAPLTPIEPEIPTQIEEAPLTPTTPMKESPLTPTTPIKESPVTPTTPIKESPVTPTTPMKESPLTPTTPIKESPVTPTTPMKESPLTPIETNPPMSPIQDLPRTPVRETPIEQELTKKLTEESHLTPIDPKTPTTPIDDEPVYKIASPIPSQPVTPEPVTKALSEELNQEIIETEDASLSAVEAQQPDTEKNSEVDEPPMSPVTLRRLVSSVSAVSDACDPDDWIDDEPPEVDFEAESRPKVILSASDVPSVLARGGYEEEEEYVTTAPTTPAIQTEEPSSADETAETVIKPSTTKTSVDDPDLDRLSVDRANSVEMSASTNENAEAGSALTGDNTEETLSTDGRPLSIDADSLVADDEQVLDDALESTFNNHAHEESKIKVEDPDEVTPKYDEDWKRTSSLTIEEQSDDE